MKYNSLWLKYYKTKEYGASMELVYAKDNKENINHIWNKILLYRDSLNIACRDVPHVYPWLPIAEKLEGGDVRDIDNKKLEELRLSIDTVSETINIDSPSAYWLARYYKAAGDSTRMIHYLAVASQNKILNQYRENPAMIELAQCLFDYGDLERAFNYIMYAGNQINAYKNRNRMVNATSIISDVKDAYNAKLKERDHMLSIYLAGLITFAVILVFFIVALINRNIKLHKIRDQLSKANCDLVYALNTRDEAIDSLKIANDKLDKLNKMKHEVIALPFTLRPFRLADWMSLEKSYLENSKQNNIPS